MDKKKTTPKKTTTTRKVGGTPSSGKKRTTLAEGTPKTARTLADAMLREAAPSAVKRRAAGKAQPAQKPQPRKPGRPSSHTPATATAICERLMTGESLRSITRDPAMPSMPTVLRWIHDDTGGFRAQYARARETQAEVLAEEVLELADEAERTITVEWEGPKGGKRRVPVVVQLDAAEVAHRRLRADARKWYASKVAPKKFGEHLNVEGGELLVTFRDLTGRKGEAPPQGGDTQA